jgi:hypothetical protein
MRETESPTLTTPAEVAACFQGAAAAWREMGAYAYDRARAIVYTPERNAETDRLMDLSCEATAAIPAPACPVSWCEGETCGRWTSYDPGLKPGEPDPGESTHTVEREHIHDWLNPEDPDGEPLVRLYVSELLHRDGTRRFLTPAMRIDDELGYVETAEFAATLAEHVADAARALAVALAEQAAATLPPADPAVLAALAAHCDAEDAYLAHLNAAGK